MTCPACCQQRFAVTQHCEWCDGNELVPNSQPLQALLQHVGSRLQFQVGTVGNMVLCTSHKSTLRTLLLPKTGSSVYFVSLLHENRNHAFVFGSGAERPYSFTVPGVVLEVEWLQSSLEFSFLSTMVERLVSQLLSEGVVACVLSFLSNGKLVIRGAIGSFLREMCFDDFESTCEQTDFEVFSS